MFRKSIVFFTNFTTFLLGVIIGAIVFSKESFPQLEVIRLMLMFFSSLLTLLAVIVSLEKESILDWLHPVKLDAVLSDDGLSEDADTEQTIVKATEYSGILSIINNSSSSAMDVTLEIISVSYKQGNNYRL